MGKNKLKQFAQIKKFPNVIEEADLPQENFKWRGKWASFFGNFNPITLELGCGKGEYTYELARKYPNRNFIGIDIKGNRLWSGAKFALSKGLKNVAFLRTRIEWIENFFIPCEINEIWITFADPQIKHAKAKHRLTHPLFLKKYQHILNANGIIHLKTDSEFLYGYTLGVLENMNCKIHLATSDLYHPNNGDMPIEIKKIQTYYEKKFLEIGKKITYLKFSYPFMIT